MIPTSSAAHERRRGIGDPEVRANASPRALGLTPPDRDDDPSLGDLTSTVLPRQAALVWTITARPVSETMGDAARDRRAARERVVREHGSVSVSAALFTGRVRAGRSVRS